MEVINLMEAVPLLILLDLFGTYAKEPSIKIFISASTQPRKAIWADFPLTDIKYDDDFISLVESGYILDDDHLFMSFMTSSPDIVILNCDRIKRFEDIKLSIPCYCYQDDPEIELTSCDEQKHKDRLYAESMLALSSQGGWRQMLYIGDSDFGGILESYEHNMIVTIVTCNDFLKWTSNQHLTKYDEDDYFNVVVHCSVNWLTSAGYRQKLDKQIMSLDRPSYNWLYLAADADTVGTGWADEGDNAVFVKAVHNSYNISTVIKNSGIHSLSIEVKWCLTDCQKGNRLMTVGNFTDPQRLQNMPTPLLPAVFQQFYGRVMDVTYASYKPFYYQMEINGQIKHLGIEIHVMDTLSEIFNFSYRLVRAVDDTWGTDIGNGTWNGMTGMVKRQEVEIAISGITVTSYRAEVIDYLFPHWEASSGVILRLTHFKWLYFLKVFSKKTWIAVACTPVAMAIILTFMKLLNEASFGDGYFSSQSDSVKEVDSDKRKLEYELTPVTTPVPSTDQNKNDSIHSEKIQKGHKHWKMVHRKRKNGILNEHDDMADNWLNQSNRDSNRHISKPDWIVDFKYVQINFEILLHIFEVVNEYSLLTCGWLLLQGNCPPVRTSALKFVYGSFWLVVIIITALYMGNLTATLAIKDVSMPFNSLEELAQETNYIFQVRIGAFREQIFREAKYGVYKRLWEKIQRNPDKSLITDQEFAYSRVLQGGYTYTASTIRLEELVRKKGNSDLVIMKEKYYKTGKAVVVQKGVPYRRHFYNVLLRLMQSGAVSYWTKLHSTKDTRPPETKADGEPLTIADVYLVFVAIMGLGLALATSVFILELLLNFMVNKVRS